MSAIGLPEQLKRSARKIRTWWKDTPVPFAARRARRLSHRKPEVLLVPDRPGWAFDFLADDIIRLAGDRYVFSKRFKHDMTDDVDYGRFDAIYFFWWAKGTVKTIQRLGIPKFRCMTVISSYLSWMRRGWSNEELAEILSAYEAVGTICRGLRDHFAPLHPHVFLTHHGIDPEVFPETSPIPERRDDDRLVVGWAGSLEHDKVEKGVTEFLAPAAEAVDGVELRLALGEQSQHPLGTHYRRDRMHEFYNSIDVCVCASKFEGAPLPLLEAGGCGRPVISTRVGIAPELVQEGHNGMLVDRTVDGFADAFQTLRDDRDRLRRMGRNNKDVVCAAWSWNARIGEYLAMFDWVIYER